MILLNRLENLLRILKLIILEIGSITSLSPSSLMSSLGEDFNELCITVWHSINFVDGRTRLIPYRDLFKIRELIVALMGSSSYFLTRPIASGAWGATRLEVSNCSSKVFKLPLKLIVGYPSFSLEINDQDNLHLA